MEETLVLFRSEADSVEEIPVEVCPALTKRIHLLLFFLSLANAFMAFLSPFLLIWTSGLTLFVQIYHRKFLPLYFLFPTHETTTCVAYIKPTQVVKQTLLIVVPHDANNFRAGSRNHFLRSFARNIQLIFFSVGFMLFLASFGLGTFSLFFFVAPFYVFLACIHLYIDRRTTHLPTKNLVPDAMFTLFQNFKQHPLEHTRVEFLITDNYYTNEFSQVFESLALLPTTFVVVVEETRNPLEVLRGSAGYPCAETLNNILFDAFEETGHAVTVTERSTPSAEFLKRHFETAVVTGQTTTSGDVILVDVLKRTADRLDTMGWVNVKNGSN